MSEESEARAEIYRQILDLAGTVLEGLEHIHRKAGEGNLEQTRELYADVTASFHEIKKGLLAHYPGFNGSEMEERMQKVAEQLDFLVLAYEGDEAARPVEILQLTLLPAYRRWQESLQEALGEHCRSTYH